MIDISGQAEIVWQQLNVQYFKAMLEAFQVAVRDRGFRFVSGHTPGVLSQDDKENFGRAIMRAKLQHVAPRIDPRDLARSIEDRTEEGEGVQWVDLMLDALAQQRIVIAEEHSQVEPVLMPGNGNAIAAFFPESPRPGTSRRLPRRWPAIAGALVGCSLVVGGLAGTFLTLAVKDLHQPAQSAALSQYVTVPSLASLPMEPRQPILAQSLADDSPILTVETTTPTPAAVLKATVAQIAALNPRPAGQNYHVSVSVTRDTADDDGK